MAASPGSPRSSPRAGTRPRAVLLVANTASPYYVQLRVGRSLAEAGQGGRDRRYRRRWHARRGARRRRRHPSPERHLAAPSVNRRHPSRRPGSRAAWPITPTALKASRWPAPSAPGGGPYEASCRRPTCTTPSASSPSAWRSSSLPRHPRPAGVGGHLRRHRRHPRLEQLPARAGSLLAGAPRRTGSGGSTRSPVANALVEHPPAARSASDRLS